jgi:translation initiation factor IF-3
MALEDAIKRAEEAGLDLIEVAATADPPVCRIADLGKFKFEQDKRARDSKKNQHVSEVKEVRLRPRTDDHDLQVRVRAARRFLEEGHKVKVEVRFRGREATHPEVARDQISRIAAGVSDIAIVERSPSLEGRSMFAILARGKGKTDDAGGGRAAAPAPAAAGRAPTAASTAATPANGSAPATNGATPAPAAPAASAKPANGTPAARAKPAASAAPAPSAKPAPEPKPSPAAGSNGATPPA